MGLDAKTAYGRRYWRENRDELLEYHRRYRAENKERLAARNASYRATNRKMLADKSRDRRYGLGPGQFDALLLAQSGRCASCGDAFSAAPKSLHVDHCHSSGEVRGLLCGGCNTAAGMLKDSARRCRQLAYYLESF